MKKKTIVLMLMMALIVSSLSACRKNDKSVPDMPSATETGSDEEKADTETENNQTDESAIEDDEVVQENTDDAESASSETNGEDKELVLNEDGTVNYLYYYGSVLSRVHYVMTYPFDDFDYKDGEDWLFEISNYENGVTNLKNNGYCLKDISGDGIPELILTDYAGKMVYNLYTLVDYEPYRVCDGYFRSRYAYMGDNKLEYYASGGAMYQTLAVYELSKNGQELIPVDYYFTGEGESPAEMVSYHNTTGENDKEKSEKIDNDEFNLKWHEYEEKITALDFTPYADKTIEVAFEDDNPGKTVVGRYTVDTTEYAQTVLVYDENGMSDIELLGLDYIDYTDKGNLALNMRYIYNMGETKGDEAIAVTMAFGETIPVCGIQYKDANGVLRKFAFDLSGQDGSVYVWEF